MFVPKTMPASKTTPKIKRKTLAYASLFITTSALLYLGAFLAFSKQAAPLYFALGEAFFNSSGHTPFMYNLKAARWSYHQAVTRNAYSNRLAHYQLGRVQFITGDFRASLDSFAKHEALYSDLVPAVHYMNGLVYAYRAKETNTPADYQAAAVSFERFLELEPNSPWGRVDLAWVLFSLGDYRAMLSVLTPALEHGAAKAWVYNMYGLAHLNLGDVEAALAHFATAQTAAEQLTVADWGAAYPGNNPADHAAGLDHFKSVIAKNYQLAQVARLSRGRSN